MELRAPGLAAMLACMTSPSANDWRFLAPNPKSAYKQLFIKGTRIRAEVIYGLTVDGDEHLSPDEIASEFSLPLEAVQEAIAYCKANPADIERDHAAEEALMEATGMNDPNYNGKPKLLTAEEMARLRRL
jgi:uncharacterized protein (DUF433 family)